MKAHHLGLFMAAIMVLGSAADAFAVKRVVKKKELPLQYKLVMSVFAGGGVPLNEFEQEGNHEVVGGDVALEMDFYFSKYMSLGAGLWGGEYNDKEFGGDLQTNIVSAGMWARLVGRMGPYVYPYLKGGAGAAFVELSEPGVNFEADPAPSYTAALGLMIRPVEAFSFNLQATYNYALTKGREVPALDGELAFDAEYVTFNVGFSLFFF